jgi:putative DNA primase/helicase
MRENYFDFKPQCKIWFLSNYIPALSGTDEAIWDRIALIPCRYRVPHKLKDKQLGEKLRAEASGILNWLIEGCLEWYDDGLKKPSSVIKVISDFRSEMDLVGRYIAECCTKNSDLRTKANDLRNDFTSWCNEAGVNPMSGELLSRRLREMGFERSKRTSQGFFWIGLGIHGGGAMAMN